MLERMSDSTVPHYLRFACALAFVGTTGCGASTTPRQLGDAEVADGAGLDARIGDGGAIDAGDTPDGGFDAGGLADASIDGGAIDCNNCVCVGALPEPDGGNTLAECDPTCCFAVGPLSPPNLPA